MMTGIMETAKRHVGRRYAAQKSMCFSIKVVGMEESAAMLTILKPLHQLLSNSSLKPPLELTSSMH